MDGGPLMLGRSLSTWYTTSAYKSRRQHNETVSGNEEKKVQCHLRVVLDGDLVVRDLSRLALEHHVILSNGLLAHA
jgi:hypothetical protein